MSQGIAETKQNLTSLKLPSRLLEEVQLYNLFVMLSAVYHKMELTAMNVYTIYY